MNQRITLPFSADARVHAAPSAASARTGTTLPSARAGTAAASVDALQSRFGLRVAARLSEHNDSLGADIGERLRFAREQALVRARERRGAGAESRVGSTASGAAVLGRAGRGGWWLKFASVVPVFALVAGLVLIQQWQDNTQISTAAEIDAGLLSDSLPPAAYSDDGFAEYLKNTE